MAQLSEFHLQDGAASIMLRSPKSGNSLSAALVAELQSAVDRCYQAGATILTLQAEGRHFCTGFDLSALADETDDSLLARFVRVELLLQSIQQAPFMTVALGHGRMAGAGADLFVACQRRLLVADASLCFPGAAFGLVLGTARLGAAVGAAKACEWVGSGRWIDAQEARASGLVHAQAQGAQLEAALEALRAESQRLDQQTRASVYRQAGHAADGGSALQALVHSAARPGLKQRVSAFRDAALGTNQEKTQ